MFYHNKTNKSFRIRDLKNGLYQIHFYDGSVALEGGLEAMFRIILKKNIAWAELEEAVLEMNRNDDDYAEFGMLGTFLFSAKDSEQASA